MANKPTKKETKNRRQRRNKIRDSGDNIQAGV